MTRKEYTKYIVSMLGGDVVDVELEDKIDNFIDVSFIQCKPYIGSTKLMTLPADSIIDLTDKGVYNIVTVYRGSAPLSSQGTTNLTDEKLLFSPTSANYVTNFLNMSLVDSIAISLLTQQVITTANGYSSDIDFIYKDNKLYLELGNAECQEVTLEYIPAYSDVEEVTEPFWENFIMRMALANTKIALGRARGKYRISNLNYELDADTLLSEGNSELETLTSKLEDMNDEFYILD